MALVMVLLALIALAGATRVSGQDLVSIAPDAAKIEYEDSRVRVVRLRIAPNASLPMHDRPARVVITLTPNNARLIRPDGAWSVTRTDAGRVAWSESTRRAVKNLADTRLENIIVELKATEGPAKALSGPPTPPPPGYLDETRHRWLFENQYVRTYDVRIPPGETTEFHRHAYDSVVIHLSGGLVSTQVQGEPWGKPEQRAAGTVAVSADAERAFTHRVRNDGAAEYHVVLVQLLR